MRTRIKFCGCTSAAEAELAVECGVDALGVIFASMSPRRIEMPAAREIARAIPAFVSLVGVFVDPTASEVAAARDAGFSPQFSGAEPAEFCERASADRYIKVHHLEAAAASDAGADDGASAFTRAAGQYSHATWMFDTIVDGKRGGTGRTFAWGTARAMAGDRAIIMSGGLTPDNVGTCIRRVRPYGVDVRSGIETNGVKDPIKMRAFIRAVKEADEQA